MIFGLDRNLTGNVLAAKRLVAWQPRGGIAVGLLLICRTIDRQ
jgi:hypothetical protein